jgi:ankyrin repeat protein
MTEEQAEILRSIHRIDNLFYTEDYRRRELPASEYAALLQRAQAHNTALVARIAELLAAGVSLDFTDQNGRTPLLVAVTQNHVELVALLLEHGADMRAIVRYDAPIHRAAEFGADRVVRFLIDRGVDPRSPTDSGRTPLRPPAARPTAGSWCRCWSSC